MSQRPKPRQGSGLWQELSCAVYRLPYYLGMRLLPFRLLAFVFVCGLSNAQGPTDKSDLTVVGRIKLEAFENSQVIDTARNLTDRYGPRLTASPEWKEAADWVVKRLQSYGLENVRRG